MYTISNSTPYCKILSVRVRYNAMVRLVALLLNVPVGNVAFILMEIYRILLGAYDL